MYQPLCDCTCSSAGCCGLAGQVEVCYDAGCINRLCVFLVAPQDVVVLLDRSRSIGFYTMEEDGMEFMETMLRTGYIIHPNYTRLAVITYAGYVTTVFDSITGKGLTGCELFANNGKFNYLIPEILNLDSSVKTFQTRKHSSRMGTARLPTIRASATICQYQG